MREWMLANHLKNCPWGKPSKKDFSSQAQQPNRSEIYVKNTKLKPDPRKSGRKSGTDRGATLNKKLAYLLHPKQVFNICKPRVAH
jgi:hypothetical protein